MKDNILHSLCIKVYKYTSDFNKGKELIDSISLQLNDCNNIQRITNIIDFYSHFGYIENALNIFNLI